MYHARSKSAYSGTAFTPNGAIALAFAAVATMLAVGIPARLLGAPLFLAVAAGQIAMVLLVVTITRKVCSGLSREHRSGETLGTRWPPARAWIGAILVGATFWYVNMRLVYLLPLPPAGETPIAQLVEVPPLWAAILAVAIVPAVCEELVFRGVLVRSLVTRWSVPFAVAVSAALFSAYHLSVIQMLPTFMLGLVFGHLALCSDSALPTMVAHFLNNAIALSLARGELPTIARALKNHPNIALACALVISAVGYAMSVSALAVVRPRTGTERP